MYSFVRVFAIVSLAAGVLPAANPVALTRQPQKFRTFYRLDDPAVPATLKQMPPPMPVGGVTAVAVASDGAVWYGSANGLVRYDAKAGERDRVQYFAGLRYLPDDAVVQLSGDRAGGMWARTQTGVSHIEFRSMTLAEKAIIFERRIRARHDRHGMVSPSRLRIPGDVTSNEMRDDDNDGLWTAMYAAAECFRYSVTRSPEALANARKALNALLFLEEVAGKRGFPARSYIEKGEPMPRGGEWHWTEDGTPR
ncbi:MAG: hypothetical protein NTY38_16225 [Acidobacteria bacterium]|nr:hypothetical protein [Acidobacteriota bacterium]